LQIYIDTEVSLAIIDPYTQLRETGALDVNPVKYTPLQSFLDAPKYIDAYSEAHDLGSKMGSMYSWAGAGEGTYGKQGLSSDVRHTLGSSAGKDAIIDWASTNLGIDPYGKFADVIGNVGITGATALEEIPDAWRSFKQALGEGDYGAITSGGILAQPWEDVQANLNAWGIPYGTTLRQKMSHVPLLNKLRSKQFIDKISMSRRKLNQQQQIKKQLDIRAGLSKVSTPTVTTGGPPSVLNPPTTPVTTGGPPSILSRPKPKPYVSPARPHGGEGGGGQRGSNRGGFSDPGKGSYGPWKADGGLINFYRYGGYLG